jgi:tetratricopeptide (TPR) repeat protein
MNLRGGLHDISQDSAGSNMRIFGLTSPKSKVLYWSAAASIAVLLAISALLQPKGMTDQELYASYFQSYKNGDNVSRSASIASANVMSAALHEIDRGDYVTALNMLKIASTDKQEGFTASFFSGEAYQALGDYKNAVKSFSEVVQHGDNLLVEQSEWYIGLCYLKMNEKAQAVNQFSSIASRHGYYSKKSSDLLKQLR